VVVGVNVGDPEVARQEAIAYPLPPLPGVTLLSVEIREVYARA
jgi:hypothetical protein